MKKSKTVLEAALKYQELEYSVIPIKPRDKRPLVKWECYQKERASAEQISRWWGETPQANVGLVTGSISGFDVIDIDKAKGEERLIDALGDELAGFNPPMVRTPRGGKHLYVKATGEGNKTGFLEGVDYRGQGGYVIAPPSQGQNGTTYTWIPGASILELKPAPLPNALINIIRNGISYIEGCGHTIGPIDHKRPQLTTTDRMRFDQGYRDNTLFHIADHLVKSGMPIEEIQILLMLIASKICNPPFPQKEIPAKIKSALKRAQNRERNIAEETREWVLTTTGHFLTTDGHKELQLTTRNEKKAFTMALLRMVEEGLLEKYGQKRGAFRRVEQECEEIDWMNADDKPFDIIWPFQIEQLALLYPKTIAIIAGTQNAGKTALALNLAYMNRNGCKVRYLSSEMGKHELKGRLRKFGYPLSDWKAIDFRERSQGFSDVILPDGLTIVDFCEISRDFWTIAADLGQIYQKLNNGVAVVCLQKSEGKDAGRGGDFGLEKPRLYLNVDQDPPDGAILTMRKAKEWAQEGINPNWYKIRFKIVSGAKLIPQGDWYHGYRRNVRSRVE